MSSSAEKVLDIPELLELILLGLPSNDHLHVQAVCKSWQAAIKLSPRIQQGLFLQAIPASKHPKTGRPKLNPHLQGHEGTGLASILGFKVLQALQNVVMRKIVGGVMKNCNHESHILVCHDDGFPNPADSRLDKHASWRPMLLSNPPCPLILCRHDKNIPFKTSASCRVEITTIGQLADEIYD